jgi:hypothetical protein
MALMFQILVASALMMVALQAAIAVLLFRILAELQLEVEDESDAPRI